MPIRTLIDFVAHFSAYFWESHLGSLPCDGISWIRVFGQTDGLLLSLEDWITKQHSGLQAPLLEHLEVLVPKLNRVLDGTQRFILARTHDFRLCCYTTDTRFKM